MNDDKIVDLYWIRSEDAITETSIKYGKYCYGIAYNILADAEDAEESVNDTYFDAWNTMPPHRPSALSAFLGKLTRRISIDRWRKRSAAKRGGELAAALDELNECVPSHENVEQDVLAADLEKRINTFVNDLPTAGAAVCFYIARILGRDVAEKLTSKSGLAQIDTFFERYGKNTILICRLLPFISFDIVSYAAGLTSMSFMSFFIATGIGQLPATIVYSYVGGMLTGGAKLFVTALMILFAISALIFMLRKIYMDRQSKKEKGRI